MNYKNIKSYNTEDIAVLKLTQSAPDYIKTVQLIDSSFTAFKSTENKNLDRTVLLSGYGTDIVKKKSSHYGEEAIASNDDVNDKTNGILRQVGNIKVISYNESEKQMRLDQSKYKGACYGDSGGPAFIKRNSQVIQIGIASRLTHYLGHCDKGSIYLNIIPYLEWIAEAQKSLIAE